jgi:acyl-CoA synthetase (AMP-forming)/AMP-acid ligase II
MGIEITGLADIIRVHAAERPDAAAVVYEGRATTYAGLDRAASQVANGLIAKGLKPQARVAHLDKSSDLFFELLFGLAKANAVMVSVNWRLAPPEVLHIVNDAEAEILFVGEEYFPVIEKIRDGLKTVREIVTLGGRHGAWDSFTAWRDRQPATDPLLPTRPQDTAVQFYTSGTTGLPKGAELTNANFACMLPLWTKTWLLAPGVPNLVCLPMFHIGGAGWGIAGLFAGATNHVVREFVPAVILEIIQRERLQVMLLVPAMILFLVQAPQIRETDLSSLRLIVYGAAPIPADLLKQAMGIFKCGFQQVYGLTETTGAITLLPPTTMTRPTSRSSCPAATRRKAWSCASSATTARTGRRARSARSPCARRRSWAATGTCPMPPGAPSRATGSSPATRATSTTRAICTSTTA